MYIGAQTSNGVADHSFFACFVVGRTQKFSRRQRGFVLLSSTFVGHDW